MIGHRRAEDDVWFVHAPLKKESRPIVQAKPPSNIPYLNGVMDTEEELEAQRPNTWFKDTDSDFIRLSKMGGRHDLLVHKVVPEKAASKEPVGYPRPAWWVDMLTYTGEDEKDAKKEKEPYQFKVPAWFVHKDKIEMSQLNQQPKPLANIIPQKEHEKIEEPRKYGQLRNYIHPVKVTKDSNQRARPFFQTSQMGTLISSDLERQRPKDYQEWKNRQDPNSFKSTKRN